MRTKLEFTQPEVDEDMVIIITPDLDIEQAYSELDDIILEGDGFGLYNEIKCTTTCPICTHEDTYVLPIDGENNYGFTCSECGEEINFEQKVGFFDNADEELLRSIRGFERAKQVNEDYVRNAFKDKYRQIGNHANVILPVLAVLTFLGIESITTLGFTSFVLVGVLTGFSFSRIEPLFKMEAYINAYHTESIQPKEWFRDYYTVEYLEEFGV